MFKLFFFIYRQFNFSRSILLLLVLLLFSTDGILASDGRGVPPKTNIEILDSMARTSAREQFIFLRNIHADTISLAIMPHPARRIAEQHILNACADSGITIRQPDSLVHPHTAAVELWVNDASVRYEEVKDKNELLVRIVKYSVSGKVTTNGNILPIPAVERTYRDTVNRSDIGSLQSAAHDFASSEPPPQPYSFFSQIAEPVIIIGSAVVTVILLFTVRSK